MKRVLLTLCVLIAAGAAHAEDPRLGTSRAIAKQFQQELGGKLMTAIKAGGPVRAIAVCSEAAPQIAARFSDEHGAHIGRTALKLRNVDNTPDEHQRAVLDMFERTLASGATQPPEHFTTLADGSARYMKAIVVQAKCLTCHGREISQEVSDAVARHYPADQATGFRVGDLRGAFFVQWPSSTGAQQ